MLTWSWKNKVGYLLVDNAWTEINLYEGNAPFIAISEWKQDGKDMYSPYTFFCDETHAKRCLGLAKGYDYIMDGITEVHLFANKRNQKVAKLWMDAIIKYQLNVKLIMEKGGE